MAKVLGGGGGLKSDNIVPVLARVNRGRMSEIEKKVKAEVEAGKKVSLRIELKYNDPDPKFSKRPTEIIYEITVDGSTETKVIKNPRM